MPSHSPEHSRDSLSDRTMVVPTIVTPELAVRETAPEAERPTTSVLGISVEAAPEREPAGAPAAMPPEPPSTDTTAALPTAPPGPARPAGSPWVDPAAAPWLDAEPAGSRTRALPHVTGRGLARALLGVVLVVLAIPTLTLISRSVFASVVDPGGAVGGLLLLAGLALVCAAVVPIVWARTGRVAEPEPAAGREVALPLGTTVFVAAGVVLLFCAAITVV